MSWRMFSVPLRWLAGAAAVLCVLYGSTSVLAQDAGAEGVDGVDAPSQSLRVVVAGSAPFVTEGADGPEGLSLVVLHEAAQLMGVSYELKALPSVESALAAVERGQADVAVGPISITPERAMKVQFTQPYMQSSLSILAPAADSVWSRVRPFLTKTFLAGIGALLFVLFCAGTAIWAVERKQNTKHFPPHPLRGIANGVWMALVTMTTVGYGDRVPVTIAGRIVTGAWMLLSMIIASSLTAFIATALTLSQLDAPHLASIDELRGRRVAVVQGTTGASLAHEHGAHTQAHPNLDAAIQSVQAGRAAAVVFDRPMLRYWVAKHGDSTLQLSSASYEPQGYGFAVSKQAQPLRDELDFALLKLVATDRVKQLAQSWLDEGAEP